MNEKMSKIILTATIGILCLIVFYPFLVMLSTSLKSMSEVFATEFSILPEKFLFENYLEAMQRGNWARYFFNSFYLTLLSVIISLVINSSAGFAFARLQFKGRDLIFIITLIGIMVPPQVTMLPVYVILNHVPFAGGNDFLGRGGLGLIDNHVGLLLPYIAGTFGVFLFRQFFINFPSALDDAAKMDGLNRIQTYYKIYIPLSGPVFASLIALKATHTWCDYTWPLILLSSDKLFTVQLALTKFRTYYETEWPLLMAATTLTILPLVITFLSVQKHFIRGIVTTGIKG
jgi:multiple sugar transport system permease protein